MLEWLAMQILVNFESFIMKLKFSFVDERKFEPRKRLGHFVFQVKKMQFRLPLSLRPPPCSVLGVTRQTPFAYLAHIYKDLNFVWSGRGGGGNLVKAVFMSVYCLLAAHSMQKTIYPCDQHT